MNNVPPSFVFHAEGGRVVAGHAQHDLLERAHSGDRTAFGVLQCALAPALERFVVRLIGLTGDEHDIVQKAFVALWSNIRGVSAPDKISPFLYRVARNLCYDELRRRGRFPHVEANDDELPTPLDAPYSVWSGDLPDEALHWVELYERVQTAMNRLPELQRQALILYAEEGLTYAQAAEAMNVDIGTIKSRIFHGRKKLEKLVGPDVRVALGMEKEGHDV